MGSGGQWGQDVPVGRPSGGSTSGGSSGAVGPRATIGPHWAIGPQWANIDTSPIGELVERPLGGCCRSVSEIAVSQPLNHSSGYYCRWSVAQFKLHFKKPLVLIILGFLISLASFLTCVVLVANPLRRLGVPPATWFGSDYTDPRCAVLSGGLELLFLGLFAFAVAAVLNRRFGLAGRLSAFWLCNPVSVAFGLLVARQLVLNGVA